MTPDEFKAKRLELGYKTRPQLARKIKVHFSTIKSWELGTRPLPDYAVVLLQGLERKK